MKNLLSITSLSRSEIEKMLNLSKHLQQTSAQTLIGKNILFAFEKPSLRTKLGSEVAINQLGGNVVHISPENFFSGDVLWSKNKTKFTKGRESMKDTVMNVSQWCDAIFARVFKHETLLELAKFSSIPIVNALCNLHHPMQAFADIYTIQEVYQDKKVTVAFVGDANNVSFSLIEILLKLGYSCKFASPAAYDFSPEQKKYFNKLSLDNNASIIFSNDAKEAAQNSNVIYTDTFVSMGEEDVFEEKMKHFKDFQVNNELFEIAKEGAKFMHCLPAHRNVEVTDEIMDSEKSLINTQAKNRMVVSKGIFTHLLNPAYEA